MSFMGIDIGTTGCKVIAFSDLGQIIASAYREYAVISPHPGWAELDAASVITHCKSCINEVAGAVKKTDPVAAIAVASQGEAFSLLDEAGNYLCNAMVSFDTRATEQVEAITGQVGLERLYQITGHSPHTMNTLFKLAWVKQHQPELFAKTRNILCFQDLLGYELTGRAVIDYSLAARTMMFDVRKKQWSSEILDLLGIDAGVMAAVQPAGRAVGTVKKGLAAELGLDDKVLVVSGGHDQVCGALGAGVIEPDLAMYATGTVECISPAFANLLLSNDLRDANLATYPHVVEGLYTTVAFNLTGGNLLRWFRDEFGAEECREAQEKGVDPYELLLAGLPVDPTQLLVLPYFVATGTPYFDVEPTSAVLGMTLNTRRGEVIKALLEGVSYEMRFNLELLAKAGVTVRELRAIGGGAKSDVWMQIKADVMGVPIVSLNVSEAGSLGCAMLAALGCGAIDSLATAVDQWVRPVRRFEPAADRAEKYRQRYQIYRQLYPTIKPLGAQLTRLD